MTDQHVTQLEDVLDAFAVEETHTKARLDRYLTAYPQFAGDLIDLSRELLRADLPPTAELAPADSTKRDGAAERGGMFRPERVSRLPPWRRLCRRSKEATGRQRSPTRRGYSQKSPRRRPARTPAQSRALFPTPASARPPTTAPPTQA